MPSRRPTSSDDILFLTSLISWRWPTDRFAFADFLPVSFSYIFLNTSFDRLRCSTGMRRPTCSETGSLARSRALVTPLPVVEPMPSATISMLASKSFLKSSTSKSPFASLSLINFAVTASILLKRCKSFKMFWTTSACASDILYAGRIRGADSFPTSLTPCTAPRWGISVRTATIGATFALKRDSPNCPISDVFTRSRIDLAVALSVSVFFVTNTRLLYPKPPISLVASKTFLAATSANTIFCSFSNCSGSAASAWIALLSFVPLKAVMSLLKIGSITALTPSSIEANAPRERATSFLLTALNTSAPRPAAFKSSIIFVASTSVSSIGRRAATAETSSPPWIAALKRFP